MAASASARGKVIVVNGQKTTFGEDVETGYKRTTGCHTCLGSNEIMTQFRSEFLSPSWGFSPQLVIGQHVEPCHFLPDVSHQSWKQESGRQVQVPVCTVPFERVGGGGVDGII